MPKLFNPSGQVSCVPVHIDDNDLTKFSIITVYDDSVQIRFIAGAIVTGVLFLVIFIIATVYFMRSKHQDELDKKSTNHLPLPLDYATNEGKFLYPLLVD